MEEIIKAEKLYKSFQNGNKEIEIIKGVDMTIKEGEFVSIMGPSGCGKSTLLYMLGGIDHPTSGRVLVNNKDINTMKDKAKSKLRRQVIGFVFQFYNLVQNLTVSENVLLPVTMDGKKSRHRKKELDEILEIVGLAERKNFTPRELSGGQQQRVAIARALIMNPKIILADEPIGNLDSQSGTGIMKLFSEISKEKKITILQVTHSQESAEYGDRIIRMKDGVIESDAKVAANIVV